EVRRELGLESNEFAILQEEELTQLEMTEFDSLDTDAIQDLETLPEESAEFSPDIPAVEMEFASSGSLPTLGGSGSGEDFGLEGGTAGTSFFGVSSSGTRFAYIVDKSGSMGNGTKMLVAKREMARSIQSLPDYAHFYILMFSGGVLAPHFQDDWMRAKKTTVARVIRWLNNEVDPGGGTQPRDAFERIFALETRPDVIFFLTDGEITGFSAEEIAAFNRRGKRVVVNTIAFGDPSSQALLKEIASQSGGVYRFVPTSGR
ncbi:MAG: VWA domain-containing protein, partial [Planctomycetota bacterium]|nr:VWA domain-containing protein [Planctomycetota bacterium]